VLITNCWLRQRGGTELYVRDLALGLQRAGHWPMVWSPLLGEAASDVRGAGVPVFDDIDLVGPAPDLIHGQHLHEATAALSRFPDTPAVYVTHDAEAWQDGALRHPRVLRHLAVDETTRERVLSLGVPLAGTAIVRNSVDLERFPRRAPLPDSPRRALMFGNTAAPNGYLDVVRAACTAAGIELDVVGIGSGRVVTRPEDVLSRYDLVFAKGRGALEAMATGCAVVLLDLRGVGGMVTSAALPQWRRFNLGRRLLTGTHSVERIAAELDSYDPVDASACADWVREHAGLDGMIESLVTHYREVLDLWATGAPGDSRAELVATAGPLARLGPLELDLRQAGPSALARAHDELADLATHARAVEAERDKGTEDVAELRAALGAMETTLSGWRSSRTYRLRERLLTLARVVGRR
jgi:hypothetical protein